MSKSVNNRTYEVVKTVAALHSLLSDRRWKTYRQTEEAQFQRAELIEANKQLRAVLKGIPTPLPKGKPWVPAPEDSADAVAAVEARIKRYNLPEP